MGGIRIAEREAEARRLPGRTLADLIVADPEHRLAALRPRSRAETRRQLGQSFGSLQKLELPAVTRAAAVPARLPGLTKTSGRVLTDQVVALIEGLPRREEGDLVFGEGGDGYSGWSRAKVRLDGRMAGLEAGTAGRTELAASDAPAL